MDPLDLADQQKPYVHLLCTDRGRFVEDLPSVSIDRNLERERQTDRQRQRQRGRERLVTKSFYFILSYKKEWTF